MTDDLTTRVLRAQANTTGWQFARTLSDPTFRRRLRDLGWVPDGVGRVYPVPPDGTEADTVAGMGAGRHLLVTADDTALHGFRLRIVEVA